MNLGHAVLLDDVSLKILVVVGAAALIFILARLFSHSSEETVHAAPSLVSTFPAVAPHSSLTEKSKAGVPAVGSEIPFPFDIVELEAQYGPRFFRPIVLNYWFAETDLVAGPADPQNFCDEFFIELEHPHDNYRWRDSYVIATPAGISAAMASDGDSARWADGTLIVPRYDLAVIMRAVMERYAESEGAASATQMQAAQRKKAPEVV